MAEERSLRSTPLNTLALLSHKELGHKGFDTSFHNPLQEMGVTVEMETSAGAWWKEQTISFLILCSSVKNEPNVWHFKCKSKRKQQIIFWLEPFFIFSMFFHRCSLYWNIYCVLQGQQVWGQLLEGFEGSAWMFFCVCVYHRPATNTRK